MSPPLNFSLLEGEEHRLDMSSSSSSSYNGPDEALLRPCTGSPFNSGQQSESQSSSGAGGSTQDDATPSLEELKQRLQRTTEEKEKLEAWCVAKERAAENIAKALLRRVQRLRLALQESEQMWRPDVPPRPIHTINPVPRMLLAAPRSSRRPFLSSSAGATTGGQAPHNNNSNSNNPACMDRSHQGIMAAFEQSVRHTTHAIRAEAARAREAEGLRQELRAANKMLNDERGLSRVLTMQAEGIQKVLGVQHDEIKNHKAEIADLRRLVHALQAENARLMGEAEEAVAAAEAATREGESGGEGGGEGAAAVEELRGRIGELEIQVKEFEESNEALKAQLDEERQTGEKLVKDTEKRVNAEWNDTCVEWCKELSGLREGLAAFEAKFVAFLRRDQGDKKEQQLRPAQPSPRTQVVHAEVQVQIQDFTVSSSSPSIIDAEWDSPSLASTAVEAAAGLQTRVKALEQKNRDLEAELANVRHAGAELAGFYPLRRFHRRVSPRAAEEQQQQQQQDGSEMEEMPITTTTTASSVSLCAASTTASSKRSWHLDVPDADEEIPELRLPSPVTPLIREKGASESTSEVVLSLRSIGDGGDESMGEGSMVEASQGEEESMWETTSASEMDSDPWSDGSVANLFM